MEHTLQFLFPLLVGLQLHENYEQRERGDQDDYIRKKMIEMDDNRSSGDETGETIGVLNKELEDLRIKNKKNTIRAKNKTLKEVGPKRLRKCWLRI